MRNVIALSLLLLSNGFERCLQTQKLQKLRAVVVAFVWNKDLNLKMQVKNRQCNGEKKDKKIKKQKTNKHQSTKH